MRHLIARHTVGPEGGRSLLKYRYGARIVGGEETSRPFEQCARERRPETSVLDCGKGRTRHLFRGRPYGEPLGDRARRERFEKSILRELRVERSQCLGSGNKANRSGRRIRQRGPQCAVEQQRLCVQQWIVEVRKGLPEQRLGALGQAPR